MGGSRQAIGTRTYVAVCTALLMLTALTTGLAYVDFGAFSPAIALLIATAKASLVGLFFMHLRGSTRLTLAVVVASIFWVGVLITLTFTDYLSRGYLTYG